MSELIKIQSYSDLLVQIDEVREAFVLLYKQGSNISSCAFRNFEDASKIKKKKQKLFLVDVKEVRDVHENYKVDSVPTLLVFKNGVFSNVIKGCMDQKYYENMLTGTSTVESNGKDLKKKDKTVIVYSTPTCSWCTKIKNYLKENNIRFREIDVAANPAMAEEMKKKSGQMGVPQTEINGQMIVGFDRPKIDRLLELA